MFLILLRRKLLQNLMEFRFAVPMLICLLLVLANSLPFRTRHSNQGGLEQMR